jgi:hypothetical protein
MSQTPLFPDAAPDPTDPGLQATTNRSILNVDPAADDGSVSLLVDADADVLVVLHGAIGHDLHREVRDLVEDLVTNAVATTGRPVRVLAENVTAFELPGVWLLLELRRAARPASVTLVAPSSAVRDALSQHGIKGILVED